MKMPPAKFVVAGTIILAAIGYLMFVGFSDSLEFYYTISELEQRGERFDGRGVRVSGFVKNGTIERDSSGSLVDFVVYERDTGKTMAVTYKGIIPDTFQDEAEVVVAGSFDPDTRRFHATTLLAKCPSKYEESGDGHPEEIPTRL